LVLELESSRWQSTVLSSRPASRARAGRRMAQVEVRKTSLSEGANDVGGGVFKSSEARATCFS
jgi:hypothetical protein